MSRTDPRTARQKHEDRFARAMFAYGACLGAVIGAGLTGLIATLVIGAS